MTRGAPPRLATTHHGHRNAVALLAGLLSACGGTHQTRDKRTVAAPSASVSYSTAPDEILALSRLGTFGGVRPRVARSWTMRFVVPNDAATDTVSYRVGTATRGTVNVNPGQAITFHLVPNAARTHEPADPFVPRPGQGRGQVMATSVPTTAPRLAVR
jgi:hypothetical protein